MSKVIWINTSLVNAIDNYAFVADRHWGLNYPVALQVNGEHTSGEFYIQEEQEGDAEHAVSTLERFLDRGVENDPDIEIVGGYKEDYEVYSYEFEGLRIIWLME